MMVKVYLIWNKPRS